MRVCSIVVVVVLRDRPQNMRTLVFLSRLLTAIQIDNHNVGIDGGTYNQVAEIMDSVLQEQPELVFCCRQHNSGRALARHPNVFPLSYPEHDRGHS